jgi:hypothetical protein
MEYLRSLALHLIVAAFCQLVSITIVLLMIGQITPGVYNVYADRLRSVEYSQCHGRLLGGC